MNIADLAMVSVYSDAMAFLLVLGLLFLPDRKYMKDKTEERLFWGLCISTLLIALFGGICYALRGQSPEWVPLAELLSKTVVELALLNLVGQWMTYVDFRLYKSRDQLLRRYRGLFIPVAILMILLIVNLFTGVLFTIRPDGGYDSTLVYDVMMAAEFIYILIPVLIIYQYDRSHPGVRNFSVMPALVPIILGSLVSVFSEYSATALGVAVGLVLLYFSMINGWRFEDTQSGYYNRALLTEIISSGNPMVEGIRGAVFFETAGDAKKLGKILRREIPQDSVIVHDSERRFVLLSGNGNAADLRFLAEMVAESLEEEKDDPISITTSCAVRKKDEDAGSFIRRTVMAEKQSAEKKQRKNKKG